MALKSCRECDGNVSEHARRCPLCGAPYPGWTTEAVVVLDMLKLAAFVVPVTVAVWMFLLS